MNTDMPTDVRGAAALLSSRLNEPERPHEESETEGKESQVEEQDVAPSKEEAGRETPEPKGETDHSDNDPEGERDTDAERKLYTVMVDGEEVQVELEELTKSYSREGHYQRKMKSLSEQRDAVEAKAAQVDEQLNEAQALIQEEISNLESPEMLELKAEDPEQYIKEVDKVKRKVERFERQRAKRAEEHQQRLTKLQAKQKQLLLEAFPDWGEDGYDSGIGELNKVLVAEGITEEELSSTAGVDHRMYLIANELRKGKAAQAELEKIRKASLESKEAKSTPKHLKAGSTKDKADRESAEVKQLKDRFRQSGNIRDGAKLLSMT